MIKNWSDVLLTCPSTFVTLHVYNMKENRLGSQITDSQSVRILNLTLLFQIKPTRRRPQKEVKWKVGMIMKHVRLVSNLLAIFFFFFLAV